MYNIKSVQNFRDFSNLKNKDNLSIKDGLFFRCGNLSKLSQTDSLTMQNLGIKYVIDLRCDVECREQPDRNLGKMQYVNMPILSASAAGITQDTIAVKELLDTMPEMTVVYKRATQEDSLNQIKKIVNFIVDADGGVAFHCTAGKDRTGIIAMLILYLLDFDMNVIYDNYLLTNKYAKPYIRAARFAIFFKYFKIKYVKRIHKLFTVQPSYMNAFLDEINKKYGSLDLFIKNGLSIDDDRKAKFKQKSLY